MSKPNISLIGYDMPRFVEVLVQSLPEIASIKLFRPPLSWPIQDDPCITTVEQALIAHALEIREALALPFWDSLLLYISTHPVDAPNLLKRATLHNSQDSDFSLVYRNDCTQARLREFIELLPVGRILAMSSKVSTSLGEPLHLPMLDFHCQVSPANDGVVKAIITDIGLRGYIAKSGRSYHFYGRTLVDEQSLITILGKSLLFCPIIDRAWIAHQLLERACGLRISPGKDYQNCPEIILEV
jgi:hypothetical protein